MGADELVWVRWGAGSMGGHKNNAWRDKNGRAGPDLDPMAGEISPNIMFYKTKVKWAQTAPYGSKWVRMCAVGCIFTVGAGKQGETGQKAVVRTYFVGVVTSKKNIK